MSRKLNFKKSPVDTRDYILKINERSVENNERIDLSSFCSTIKNQGSIGSCTAHASVALMEFMFKKFNIITDQDLFSEKFVYYTTRVKIENISPTEDSGCYLRDTMKGLRAYGSALEASFPYLKESEKDCDISECPSDSVFNEASKYQIIRYVSISDDNPSVRLDKLKTVLKEGYGFVGGFLFYETTLQDNNGFIGNPDSNEEPIGGHAVLFVGYDDSKSVFKFKNSWGQSWGENGYGFLPYSYVLENKAFDFWTILEQENNDCVFGVIKPTPSEQNTIQIKDMSIRDSILESMMSNILASYVDKKTVEDIEQFITNSDSAHLFDRDIVMLKEFSKRINRVKEQFQTVFEKIKNLHV